MPLVSARPAAVPMKTISIKVSQVLAARIEDAAEATERSKSDLLRDAIEQYLIRGELSTARSFSSEATDLSGCLEGPDDLSFNPRHLEGYGS